MAKGRNFGKEFEEEVKSFLEDKFKFEDVKTNFHIAPSGSSNEVDVAGRFKEILFIFQCTAAGRKVKRNLREKIFATRERAKIILQNYKNIPEYSKCKFVIFIFITKKIELPKEQIEILEKEKPKIWYADEHMLEYYSDLYDKIGEYAVYNFLADFGVRPPPTEQICVTALKTKLGKYNAYSFYVRPKHLLKFSYVARRRSKKEDFYQRMLEKSRIKNIRKFIDGGGVFPTNIIISLKRGEHEFRKVESPQLKDVEVGLLRIYNSYNACWIIDGQHRLYSFSNSTSNCFVPCIAFEDIDISQERSFFLEINREQKPIQPDLLWDLEGQAHPDTPRGIISNIVRKLNFKEPFADQIYIPLYGSKSGKRINMAAFCNGIVNAGITKRITPNCIGQENPLFIENSRTMVNRISGVIERYFKVIISSLEDEYKAFVLGNAGVPIMLYLLEPIVARIGRIPSMHDFERYGEAIKEFFEQHFPNVEDIKKLRVETTSEASRRELSKQIGLFIRKYTKDREFWPKMEESEFIKDIIKMERRIGKFIADKLSEITTSWEKQRVPEAIRINAYKKMETDGTDFDENFDLGEELQIIIRKDNWSDVFKSLFINKKGFVDQTELKLAFRYLSKIRNPALHGKSFVPTKEDFDQCRIYLQKLDRIIPEYLDTTDGESPEIIQEN